jgi:hypothetical protein
MKIHLGDEAERDRGIFLRTQNTAPLYSKSQTIDTIPFHFVTVFKFEFHTSAAIWQLLSFSARFQVYTHAVEEF